MHHGERRRRHLKRHEVALAEPHAMLAGRPLRAEKLALNIRRRMKRLFVRDGFRYSPSEDKIGLFTDG